MATTPKNTIGNSFQSRLPYWSTEAGAISPEMAGNVFAATCDAIMQLCETYSTSFQVLFNGPFDAHRQMSIFIDQSVEATITFFAELHGVTDGPLRDHLKVWDMTPVEALVSLQEGVMTVGQTEEDGEDPLTSTCTRCGSEIASFDNGEEWFHTKQNMNHKAEPAENDD